jgi:DNA-binding NarL/FixJ family response regulator
LNLQTAETPVRVAIVEDDLNTRKMIADAITAESGFSIVAEFGEGITAIASLAKIAPDVVLVDIGLPDISGIEVIRAVTNYLQQCDILVISALGDERTIISALEAGADGYILKGVEQGELRKAIADLRNGGSPLSPMAARSILDKFSPKNEVNLDIANADTQLTAREIQILQTIARGHTYVETAKMFCISSGTVHSHLKSIYRKLEVSSKTLAINHARSRKLIT